MKLRTCESGVQLGILLLTILFAVTCRAQTPPAAARSDQPWLKPYDGPNRTDVDATTFDGKVLCGYQGWHNTPNDGGGFGWTHWGQNLDRLGEGGGRFVVDMWPDVREHDPADLEEVPGLKMPDGSPARL